MRARRGAATAALALTVLIAACQRDTSPTAALAWAYPAGMASTYGQPLGPGPFRVPDSKLVLTRAQFDKADGLIDWHPEDHPPAPQSVGGPQTGKATPCAECHLFNGAGFPASADLAGLPASYIIEQVMTFRTGERRSAKPDQPNTAEMIKTAKAVSPEALREAAAYFAALPRSRWVRVVETERAPRTWPDKYGWLNAAPGGETEPVGDRIVELSGDLPRMMIGDDHVMLTDYAPPGSVARGKHIVETGGGGGLPCASCHGEQLEGTSAIPPIAGRPAGYVARTLWDIRTGARNNAAVAPMRAISNGLTPAQIRDVSAYLASLRS